MVDLRSIKKQYWQLKADVRRFNPGAMYGLAKALKEFFRDRVIVEQAKEEIKKALDTREERFLELARSQIYERPNSPYLKLLKFAGCDYSDLIGSVNRKGLEQTLEQLAKNGVYLTSDEFKGKKEVVRGSFSFRLFPSAFHLSYSKPGYHIQSSGTKSKPTVSLVPLDWLAREAFSTSIFFLAHDLFSDSHALYEAVLPGAGGFNVLLQYAKMEIPVDRWFARRVPVERHLVGAYHHLMTNLVVYTGKIFAPRFPAPEFVDISDVRRIVYWMAEKNRVGRCCIKTPASNATRISQEAWKRGISLQGASFIVSGEPLTQSKWEIMTRAGAKCIARYTYGGGITVGMGCPNPTHPDDVHVNRHTVAVIRNPIPRRAGSPAIHPLLLTTLYPSASRLHLNVESGDYATLETRSCGCALDEVGFKLHLYHIRSFEKFTSEGMNYFYGDLYDLFEKSLPSEFGGCPGDYQLAEEEDANGQTRITLRIHPEVGEIDDRRVLSRLRDELVRGSWGNAFQTRIWQIAGTLRIKREAPYASPRGKILPLHIVRGLKDGVPTS